MKAAAGNGTDDEMWKQVIDIRRESDKILRLHEYALIESYRQMEAELHNVCARNAELEGHNFMLCTYVDMLSDALEKACNILCDGCVDHKLHRSYDSEARKCRALIARARKVVA